ncbi:MAG: 2,3,4,5-tetrahydropyridine-2,6-dicarboxylate N-succinyltransferase, partial [Alphaproteobacteria bacterium]|nr:2,3,4,5-tetrahydropyridine-2,6-dicarboxylate N-succinyltransferase [Alphaproteobacteria bacterium]
MAGSFADLAQTIDQAWEDRAAISASTQGAVREAVNEALDAMDSGKVRVAEKIGGEWEVRQWCKKAVLLSFRLNDSAPIKGGPGNATWFDKVPSKFDNWGQAEFAAAGFRAVPGAVVRHSAFIAKGAVLM